MKVPRNVLQAKIRTKGIHKLWTLGAWCSHCENRVVFDDLGRIINTTRDIMRMPKSVSSQSILNKKDPNHLGIRRSSHTITPSTLSISNNASFIPYW